VDRIDARLTPHRVIGVDTSIFIYVLERHERYATVASGILRHVQRGDMFGVTSVITLMELAVKPLQINDTEIANQYDRLLLNFPNLSVIEIELAVARRAAGLRAKYGLRPSDALQLAACISAGSTAFVTNDAKFRHVQEVDVLHLNDFTR
jgi:predicted nucleic acid-binding protein